MSPSDKNPLHRPDGIPGSYTTGKLIKTLQKNEPNPDSRSVIGFKVVPVSPATASRSPAVPDLIKAPASAAPPPRLAPALPVQAVPQAPPPRPAPALPATQVSPPQDPTG